MDREATYGHAGAMLPSGTTAFAIMALLVILALALAALRGRRASTFPVSAKRLLTKSETEFLHKLVAAAAQAGGLHVCPQVSMGAVMQVDRGLDPSRRMAIRNRFGSKIIDFVLIDRHAAVRLIVELDDPSHRGREKQDALRDWMTSSAGLRTLRIPDGRAVTVLGLVKLIGDATK